MPNSRCIIVGVTVAAWEEAIAQQPGAKVRAMLEPDGTAVIIPTTTLGL